MKEKKKDKFYRNNLKHGISITTGLLIIGCLFLLFGLYNIRNKITFIKTAEATEAQIIDIKYRSAENELTKQDYQKIDVEDVQYIVIKYTVNNVEYVKNYNGANSLMYIGKNINIYYNSSNPNEFVIIDFIGNATYIILSVIFIVTGIVGIFVEMKKIIRYVETLNGVEVKADIVRVIEVTKWGRKEYKIECRAKDESGEMRTFYTRSFDEGGLENIIKKLKLDTLTVRYKKYYPNKYIVLTEKLEKELSK